MTIDEKIAEEKVNAEKLRKTIETGYDGGISIKALFCDDTAAIKEVYERFENCAEYHEQIAEWLEDYKHIKQWKSDIMDSFCKYDVSSFEELIANARNKAIDDFVKALQEKIEKDLANPDLALECKKCGIWKNYDIKEIAEQLKAGGK